MTAMKLQHWTRIVTTISTLHGLLTPTSTTSATVRGTWLQLLPGLMYRMAFCYTLMEVQ